jgi:hypothetical protein
VRREDLGRAAGLFFSGVGRVTIVVYHCICTYLEWVYKGQVIQSNIVVIILDVTESFLVIFHQRIDLAVFALQRKKLQNKQRWSVN